MRCKGDENISLEIKVFKSFSTPREFRGEGGGGRRKKLTLENTCNSVDFVWFFEGKQKVGDQSSPTECKRRLLKTDTLLRRKGDIRILQYYRVLWGIMLFLS